ncbi:MAG TPA: serine/threonine-protein phosphatase [Chloroflexi bacterium]|nr:serine/threonine-protein phosphatase [Chloroflexota bacterium]
MGFWRIFRRRKVAPRPEEKREKAEAALAADHFRVGWATDIGQMRQRNEDAVLVMTAYQTGGHGLVPFGLFILADGMGGHRLGDIASALAIRTVARHIIAETFLHTLEGEEPGADQPALREILIDAYHRANDAVAREVPGAGTTLTCVLFLGSRAYIAHVGDSRAYLVHPDGLDQITRDHSLVDRLVELGQLTPAEAANHPHRNVLYRAVGQKGELEVETYMRVIPPGSRLLLCSDGLWGVVDEGTISQIIRDAPSPQAACDRLIQAANEAGGRDNITAILVEPPRET